VATRSKLLVIVHADIVASTALVQRDERIAHDRIQNTFYRLSETIAAHGGTTHEIRGDALVAEFARASDAVTAAVEFQKSNCEFNNHIADEIAPEVRIGISLGEVVVADDTLTGPGVVLAQRVEQLARANGICVTAAIHEATPQRLPVAYENLGDQVIKGFDEPIRVYRVGARESEPRKSAKPSPSVEQQIRFCTVGDGVRIAYALVGQGPTIVKSANWMNHLEYDWESPVWRHMFEELSRDHLLVRYDARGNGLSDWEVEDISFDAFVRDLEAVIDVAAPERFALLGISQGCAVSVAYAVRHPERISHLILYGGSVKGWRLQGSQVREKWEAMNALMRHGWGQDNPAFRQMFTALFMPGATPEQMHWFNDLQRASTSPENALRIREAIAEFDVEALLPKISAPTLVLHARDDAVAPFKAGREYAIGIPGARFVPLESQNHLLLESEPAWSRFLSEIKTFLAGD